MKIKKKIIKLFKNLNQNLLIKNIKLNNEIKKLNQELETQSKEYKALIDNNSILLHENRLLKLRRENENL